MTTKVQFTGVFVKETKNCKVFQLNDKYQQKLYLDKDFEGTIVSVDVNAQ